MARTALYRFFDEEDRLLYVGITDDIGTRWAAHATRKHWWGSVTRREVDWLGDRLSAVAAERDAIINERPLYNVIHAPDVRRKVRVKIRLQPHGTKPSAPLYALVMATLTAKGKSKSWLSEESGVSRNTIENWAKQPRPARSATVHAVAKVLGIDPERALTLAGVLETSGVAVHDGVLDLSAVPIDALLAELRRRIPD